jgi:TRAP-type mannitol/chloroaromatic compound transport system permease large subunit
MTDPQIAVFMLGIFIFTILLGFPIAFTLMAMGVGFGYYAYYDVTRMQSIFDNRIFDLLVNQTYSVMANDVLTAVPLFLFMGYIVERANIVDRLFHTLYIASRRMPGAMAVAALATCAMFATATGIVGAVVTLMGLLAFPAMLKARYDTSFAAGVICAGGCLGILIPPSIMLIVYSATSTVSAVKLYAGALFPGFMLAGLYMIYVIGRSIINPKLAPKPRPEDIPDVTGRQVLYAMATSFFPLAFLILAVLGSILFGLATPSEAASMGALGGIVLAVSYRLAGIKLGNIKPEWEGKAWSDLDSWLFALGFGAIATLILAVIYVILYVIVTHGFGVSLPREPGMLIRPGVGVALALIIGFMARAMPGRVPLLGWLWPQRDAMKRIFSFAGRGAVIGSFFGVVYLLAFTVFKLNTTFAYHKVNFLGLDIGFFIGMAAYMAWKVNDQDRLRESIYLTVRTSAMVCWLFVGSWTFSSVFSYLGGEQLIKDVVLSMDLSRVTFLLMAQAIIFFLGWPLEWSEIIIIFVPIFLPLLPHFDVDPLFFGILVALNLQTSFLTPPMAMAAYYLKGVAPPHVTLVQIFKGVMPFLSMIFLSMIILYIFPEIAMWLPGVMYGR